MRGYLHRSTKLSGSGTLTTPQLLDLGSELERPSLELAALRSTSPVRPAALSCPIGLLLRLLEHPCTAVLDGGWAARGDLRLPVH